MHRCISGLLVVGLVCLGAASARCADEVPLPPPPAPPAPAVPEQPPVAGETPAAPAPPATAPATPAVSRTAPASTGGIAGRIVNGRVNIRSGPSTRFEIVVTLDPGVAVKVYCEQNGWYQIAYPESQHCYVHQRHIQGDIVDIPREGLLRSINGQEAKVRVRPWNKSTAVGRLKQGDLVTVVGIRGRWAKIKPPASARVWVFGKYVKTEGEVGPGDATATAPAPPDHGGAKQAPAGKPKQQEKSRLAKLAEEKKRRYFEMLARRDAEDRRKRKEAIKRVYDDINARLDAIEREEHAEETPSVVPPPAPNSHAEPPAVAATAAVPAEAYKPGEQDMGGFTGWVEYIGRVGKRPAAFRLVKGGEVFFLLRSSKFNLAEYVNRRVAVDGTVEPAPGFQANVMEVTSLRLLDSPPVPVRAQKVKIQRPYAAPHGESTAPPPAPADSESEEGAKPAGGEATGIGSRLPSVENEAMLVPAPAPAAGATKAGGDAATDASDKDSEAGKRERVFTPGE